MKRSDFMKLAIGDKVRLVKDVEGRYSGYGGNPKFVVKIGDVVTVRSEHPLIFVRGDPNGVFVNCDHSHWKEGVSVCPKDCELQK